MQQNLTEGSIRKKLLIFSIPYLISVFLQTFYGMADLFFTGRFNGASSITAVSIGSQVMHMITVMIVGLAMGSTVLIARNVGAGDRKQEERSVGNSIILFLIVAAASTAALLLLRGPIIRLLHTPPEAVRETGQYLLVCFIGIPFIIAYNVISSIFRGIGDTKSPMLFVMIAGLVNIVLDYILIGPFSMGAQGAAVATVISQAASVAIALLALGRMKLGIRISRQDLKTDGATMKAILGVGVPIAVQDGIIQITFLVITTIANGRGVKVAAAVGVTEKLISFIFLVPSAMQAAVTAMASQNAGAGKDRRSRQTLRYAMQMCTIYAVLIILISEIFAPGIIGIFTRKDPEVIRLGVQYFRTYVFDVLFAGFHFCFSGFFGAYNKAIYSFIHNVFSGAAVRIPGALLATALFPETLYALGVAAPVGSVVSTCICAVLFRHGLKKGYWGNQ